MAKRKHIPIRTCIICRHTFTKNELIRLAMREEGVFEDKKKKYLGRGAYVCHKQECLAKVLTNERKCLDRAFRRKVKFLNLFDLNRKEAKEALQGVK